MAFFTRLLQRAVGDGYGSMWLTAAATAFYAVPLTIAAGQGPLWPADAPAVIEEAGDEVDALADATDDRPSVRFVALPAPPPEPVPVPEDVAEAEETDTVDADDGGDPPAAAPKADPRKRGDAVADVGTPVAPDGAVDGTGDGTGEAEAAPGLGEGAGKAVGAGRGRKVRACDKPNPNIRVGNDGIVEIDRVLVDKYTKNLESFMSLGYSRPFGEEGLKGWYISGFSCTSPVHKAGFRRGDVLLSVNGRNTRSWVGVYMLYQKLKNRTDFEVALVRRGEPVTLRFRVVDG